jgi:hypothetical protein
MLLTHGFLQKVASIARYKKIIWELVNNGSGDTMEESLEV